MKPWELPTNRTPTEHEEQQDFVRFFRRTFAGVLIYATPNGGFRNKAEAGRLKLEGVTAGIPDLFVPAFRWYCEMKDVNGGDGGSKVQLEMHVRLRIAGYRVDICHGSLAAQKVALEVAGTLPDQKF